MFNKLYLFSVEVYSALKKDKINWRRTILF